MYYKDKRSALESFFGQGVTLTNDTVILKEDKKSFRVVNDVIVMDTPLTENASDVQISFGQEWSHFDEMQPEHYAEFDLYFEQVDLGGLRDKVVCDLGCGMGRWSKIMFEKAEPNLLVCIDFSDAIFSCRENLRGHQNVIFIKADILRLELPKGWFDFLFSLGVLHHTTEPALSVVRSLQGVANSMLFYLYYDLADRPWFFRWIFRLQDLVRKMLVRLKSDRIRKLISYILAVVVYLPFIGIGKVFSTFGLEGNVPLYSFYKKKSLKRIAQDAFDRFFTSIEQRVSKDDIYALKDTFDSVSVSDTIPYWKFMVKQN